MSSGQFAACIGRHLQHHRKLKKIRAEDAARVAGMSCASLRASEQGRRQVLLSEAAKLAELYGLSVDRMLRECNGRRIQVVE